MKEVIDLINQRMDKLEKKIDDLQAFKFQILGGACVLTVVGSLILRFVTK
jgi:hypothetical protein